MGGSYSDLNVYLTSKIGIKYGTGYNVTPTQKNFPGCSDFQLITHTITFTPPADGLNYNVVLYDGSSDASKGSYIFGYYYPRDSNQVVKNVHVYYSVLAPNDPLVISFETKTNTYNCPVDKLVTAGWDRSYYIEGYSIGPKLSKYLLDDEFKKRTRKRKIQFKIEKVNKEITASRQELGDGQNFRFIFIPKGNESVLGSDYLFSINFIKEEPKLPEESIPEAKELCVKARANNICERLSKKPCKIHGRNCHRPKFICEVDMQKHLSSKPTERKIKQTKNKINEYYLTEVDGKLYDGVIVYLVRDSKLNPKQLCEREVYNEGKVLLLEFYESSKEKVQIQRKDENGYWWSQEKVDYNDDKTLLERLGQIKLNAKDEFVTIILEKKDKYDGLQNFDKDDNKKTYTQYTHKFQKANKPNLLFGRKTIQIGPKGLSDITAQNVEVYYLKTKSVEDTQPFLIVFDKDGAAKKNKKAYHFANKYGFDEWKEFEFKPKVPEKALSPEQLVEKLEDRLRRIEESLKCLDNLTLLRLFAHKILTGDDPEPDEVKKKVQAQRPEVKKQETVAKDDNLEIILGSVGGVVGVVSLMGGYGIYWYNTTIKLLT